jgi:hypothetical protein
MVCYLWDAMNPNGVAVVIGCPPNNIIIITKLA